MSVLQDCNDYGCSAYSCLQTLHFYLERLATPRLARGVVSIWSMFVFLMMLTLPRRQTIRICKTSGAAKVYWRRLNSKRSLPVLDCTSESDYFETFVSRPRAITLPLAAHTRRGVITVQQTVLSPSTRLAQLVPQAELAGTTPPQTQWWLAETYPRCQQK